MRYHALACDYDGTLAAKGAIDPGAIAALERCRQSGRRLLLVTGRELDELQRVCLRLDLFDWVVAENGALLYRPADKTEKLLGQRPHDDFINALAARGVERLSVGRVIVATWEPHESTVLETIRDFGLELQVIFNKGAVMVLPSGINKATGLAAALLEMGLSRHNVVGVGDAENDHAFLDLCETSAAVENALPQLKERADIQLARDHGPGVTELIDRLIDDDLASVAPALQRRHILLGHDAEDRPIALPPHGLNWLIAGTSGSGKSTLATAFVERVAGNGYQFCVIDPEGDYDNFLGAVPIGNPNQPPNEEELLKLLEDPRQNAVVNLIGVPFEARPAAFMKVLTRLQELRARTGRPHWVIVDEAHHVLPSSYDPSMLALPQHLDRVLFITLEPNLIAPTALAHVCTLVAVGESPEATLENFAEAMKIAPPQWSPDKLNPGEVVLWRAKAGDAPFRFKVAPGQAERRRHSRKYAEGELEPDRSFFFRGPEGKLKLRAQNLILFLQLADGVDDETWLFHLAQGDYSRWFREAIKDDRLGEEAAAIETAAGISVDESRRQIREAVERLYTMPGAKKRADEEKSPTAVERPA